MSEAATLTVRVSQLIYSIDHDDMHPGPLLNTQECSSYGQKNHFGAKSVCLLGNSASALSGYAVIKRVPNVSAFPIYDYRC